MKRYTAESMKAYKYEAEAEQKHKKSLKKSVRAMKTFLKCVNKIKFVSCVLVNNTIVIELIKIFADDSNKNEKYTLTKNIVERLKKATSQKEFASIVNNEFVKQAHLDAQAKKQQLTKNTQYCTSRNYIALAMNRLEFAEVAFRQRHEATATLKKVAKAKKATKKVTVKK